MQYLQLLQLLHELIFLEVILTGLLPQLSLYRTLFSIYLLRTFSVPSPYQVYTNSENEGFWGIVICRNCVRTHAFYVKEGNFRTQNQ